MQSRYWKLAILGTVAVATVLAGLLYYNHWYKENYAIPYHDMLRCGEQLEDLYSVLIDVIRDNGSTVPEPFVWCDIAADNCMKEKLTCPNSDSEDSTYCFNKNLLNQNIEGLDGDVVFMFASEEGWNSVGGKEDVFADRHRIGAHRWVIVIFVNGEVDRIPHNLVDNLKWKVVSESGK